MRTVRILRDVWLIIGITILFFLVVEFIGFVAVTIHRPNVPRAELAVYKDFKEAREFWIEHEKTWKDLSYAPFHLWQRGHFSGRWTNVGADGIRFTHYNADSNNKDVKKIFMFGGSTLWGTGSPDWQTIPSYLAGFLNEKEARYVVTNYGETGFVSGQGLNRLISEIKKGNVPDIVIFYSGINDASSGGGDLLALKTPSYHSYMEDRFRFVFKRGKLFNFMEILKTTYVWRGIEYIKSKIFPPAEWPWEKAPAAQKEEAVRRTAKYWVDNYRMASAIGREYGFKVVFLLQPNIYVGRKIPQDYEKDTLAARQGNIAATYDRMRKMANEGNLTEIYDISDSFDNMEEPIYIDWAHVGPKGNYYVAARIYNLLKDKGYW